MMLYEELNKYTQRAIMDKKCTTKKNLKIIYNWQILTKIYGGGSHLLGVGHHTLKQKSVHVTAEQRMEKPDDVIVH